MNAINKTNKNILSKFENINGFKSIAHLSDQLKHFKSENSFVKKMREFSALKNIQ
jgi:hypothetical protein